MSKIKWITKQEVREYATTPERALDISYRHHQQIVDATEEQLATQGSLLSSDLCGLCWYYDPDKSGMYGNSNSCGLCPLREDDVTCYKKGSLYQKALRLYNAKPFNHKKFIKAETALLNRLKQLKNGDKGMETEQEIKTRIDEVGVCLDKLRDEESDLRKQLAEAEVTYSIGDRFIKDGGSKWILVADTSSTVLMARLCDGCRWGGHIEVKKTWCVTAKEFEQFDTHGKFTRYWNKQKKEKE